MHALAASLASMLLSASAPAVDEHNPPIQVAGVDVIPERVGMSDVQYEKRLKTEGRALICKRIQPTGTRLGKGSVCTTNSDWAERRRQDQIAARRQQGGTLM